MPLWWNSWYPFFFYIFVHNTCRFLLDILPNFNRLQTSELVVFYFREFTAAINFPCSKSWLRISENDIIFFKNTARVEIVITINVENCTNIWGKVFVILYTNWRVRWKKGVRFFTQKWTLSKTLQISHAVLFGYVEQCSACVLPETGFLFEILHMQKTLFSKGILWGPFVECKTKETFCFAKRWSHCNTLISYYCFVSASGWGA